MKKLLFAALLFAATSCTKSTSYIKPIIVKSDTGTTVVIGTPLLLPK